MLLNYRNWLLLLATLCLTFTLRAQTKTNNTNSDKDISGFVCTRGTSVRLAQVMVTNKSKHVVVFTDEYGVFKIKAAIGDSLEFNKTDYTVVTLPVIGLPDMVVFMQQVIHLSQVTIMGQTKKQELAEYMDGYRKKGVYNGGKVSALSAINSPINAVYSIFSKDARDAKRFAAFSKKEEEAAQDNRKYNKELVKKITGLSDEDVQKFMDTYRPLHEDLMKMTDYDVIQYIKTSLESFKKYGATPLQKLY